MKLTYYDGYVLRRNALLHEKMVRFAVFTCRDKTRIKICHPARQAATGI